MAIKCEPGWANLTRAAAKAVKMAERVQRAEQSITCAQPMLCDEHTEYRSLIERRQKQVQAVYAMLLFVGGGKECICNGQSAKVGKAGIALVNDFIEHVLRQRLAATKRGTKVSSILSERQPLGYDQISANNSCRVVLNGFDSCNSTDEQLTEIAYKLFGRYLFEIITIRLQRKLTNVADQVVVNDALGCIEKYILAHAMQQYQCRGAVKWSMENKAVAVEQILRDMVTVQAQ